MNKALDKSIGLAIEKYVNGGLRDIKKHLEAQDKIQMDIVTDLSSLKSDVAQLKMDTTPVVETRKAMILGGKFMVWIISIVAGVGTAIITIKQFYTK